MLTDLNGAFNNAFGRVSPLCVMCRHTHRDNIRVFHDKHRIYIHANVVKVFGIQRKKKLVNSGVNEKSEWMKNNSAKDSII